MLTEHSVKPTYPAECGVFYILNTENKMSFENKKTALPDIDYLIDSLCINMSNGELVWKKRPINQFNSSAAQRSFNSNFAGKIAGSKHRTGYMTVSISGVRYAAHRIVFAIVNGFDPGDLDIDHINGNRLDNAPSNLRACSRSENISNQKKSHADSYLGIRGVCKRTNGKSYRACVTKNYKRHEKIFKDINSAITWVNEKRLELFGDLKTK